MFLFRMFNSISNHSGLVIHIYNLSNYREILHWTCRVVSYPRAFGWTFRARIVSIEGMTVDYRVLKKGHRPKPKPAKMTDSSVYCSSISTHRMKLKFTLNRRGGARVKRARKKRYIRCLRCSSKVFAPNTRSHFAIWKERHSVSKPKHGHRKKIISIFYYRKLNF